MNEKIKKQLQVLRLKNLAQEWEDILLDHRFSWKIITPKNYEVESAEKINFLCPI